VAGKTGTTNDSNDTWFIGFSPDLVAGVYIGYDKPRTLGKRETGGSVALPAFISFMKEALKDEPNKPFRVPRGIQLVKVDLATGQQAGEGSARVIDEAFVTGGPIFIPGVSGPYKAAADQKAVVVSPPKAEGEEGEETDEVPEIAGGAPPANPQTTAPPVVGTGALY
ncbi:MAG: penicillin-binding protein, partial [Proteobacteria bacterium]|nr:penicillin-binding protein [Pseudomonadota bacterium]